MTPFYEDEPLESMFSTRDPEYHKNLKRPVAQLFSMTNMRNYETYADDCTAIFINAMRDFEGQAIDLSKWLQWYAFDVIACITFQRSFAFMEERRDVDNMIGDLHGILGYVKILGQIPNWHPWPMGSRTFVKILKTVLPMLPDPLFRFVIVCSSPLLISTSAYSCNQKITEEEIVKYDQASMEKQAKRTDFLAQIRSKQTKGDGITRRDLMNHLSNNLCVASQHIGLFTG